MAPVSRHWKLLQRVSLVGGMGPRALLDNNMGEPGGRGPGQPEGLIPRIRVLPGLLPTLKLLGFPTLIQILLFSQDQLLRTGSERAGSSWQLWGWAGAVYQRA